MDDYGRNDNAPASFDIGARIRLPAGARGHSSSLRAILPNQRSSFNPFPCLVTECPGRACNSAALACPDEESGRAGVVAVKRGHRVKGKPCGLMTDGWLRRPVRFQNPIPSNGGRGAYSLQIHQQPEKAD